MAKSSVPNPLTTLLAVSAEEGSMASEAPEACGRHEACAAVPAAPTGARRDAAGPAVSPFRGSCFSGGFAPSGGII